MFRTEVFNSLITFELVDLRIGIGAVEVALAVPTSLIRNVPVGETIEVRVDNVDPRRDLLVLKMLDPA